MSRREEIEGFHFPEDGTTEYFNKKINGTDEIGSRLQRLSEKVCSQSSFQKFITRVFVLTGRQWKSKASAEISQVRLKNHKRNGRCLESVSNGQEVYKIEGLSEHS